MIASTHLATGGAAGIVLSSYSKNRKLNLLLALLAGIALHCLLDNIPHQEYPKEYIFILFIFDFFLALLLIYKFGFSKINLFSNCALVLGAIGSALSDVPDVLVDLAGLSWRPLMYLNQFNSFFHARHNGFAVSVWIQLIIFVIALCLINICKKKNET